MFLVRVANLKVVVLVLICGALGLVMACDAEAPPMTISNATDDTIIISFVETRPSPLTDGPYALPFREVDGGEYQETYSLPPRTTIEIDFKRTTERLTYPLTVNRASGDGLFQRTFLLEEIKEREWEITITPEGIR